VYIYIYIYTIPPSSSSLSSQSSLLSLGDGICVCVCRIFCGRISYAPCRRRPDDSVPRPVRRTTVSPFSVTDGFRWITSQRYGNNNNNNNNNISNRSGMSSTSVVVFKSQAQTTEFGTYATCR